MSNQSLFPDANGASITNLLAASFGTVVEDTSPGGTPTIDWTAGIKQRLVLDADITSISFTDPPGATNLILELWQPSAGGPHTITGWDADVLWVGGTAPTLTASADAKHLISFYFNGTDYLGQFPSADFS